MKGAVRAAAQGCAVYRFVLKSDVASYYASIDHVILLDLLGEKIDDAGVLDLLGQFLAHLDDVGGELHPVEHGISKGSPLSPLLGAVYLQNLDASLRGHAERHSLLYLRFMDDWLLLCHSRRQLRVGVRLMNRTLASLKLQKARDKTFIGKLSKGFDFLGYHLGPWAHRGVAVAKKTWINHWDKLARLYEQGASLMAPRQIRSNRPART